jgi:hypothetical protein
VVHSYLSVQRTRQEDSNNKWSFNCIRLYLPDTNVMFSLKLKSVTRKLMTMTERLLLPWVFYMPPDAMLRLNESESVFCMHTHI